MRVYCESESMVYKSFGTHFHIQFFPTVALEGLHRYELAQWIKRNAVSGSRERRENLSIDLNLKLAWKMPPSLVNHLCGSIFWYLLETINTDRMTQTAAHKENSAVQCGFHKHYAMRPTVQSRSLLKSTTQTRPTNAWETVNVVLQTPLFESHTGTNIAKVLQVAVTGCM